MSFTSTYEHGVDVKRRVQVPSKWRPKGPGFEFTMVQWPKGVGGAIYLLALPPAQVQALMDKINEMERTKEISPDQATTFRRLVFGKAETLKLDTAGRICLPDEMAKLAGIAPDSPVVLVGAGERFEIWNPDRFEAKNAEDKAHEEEALKLFSL
jgi:MraZ protein